MASKVKLTRPELKKQRDALKRFQRYLPMLKLRQSQLQSKVNQAKEALREAEAAAEEARRRCAVFRPMLADWAGIDVLGLAEPTEVITGEEDVAGISVPTFERVSFAEATYSLFGTPVWVDGAIELLRQQAEADARIAVVAEQVKLIESELKKTIQRVNLFEQVKIPESKDIIRRIRIVLGDEMTSAIGRSKIAKGKLAALADAIDTDGEEAA